MRSSGSNGSPLRIPSVARRPSCSAPNSSERFVLNDLVQHLEHRTIFGRQRVGAGTGAVHEVPRAGTVRERVDLEVLREPLDGLVARTDFSEAAHHHPDPVARGFDHEVPVGDVAVVVRGHEQVLAALTLVRPHETEVHQELEARVIGRAHHAGRDLDHGGAVDLQVERRTRVHGGVVAGQEELARLPAGPGSDDDVRRRREPEVADVGLDDAVHGQGRVEVHVGLRRPLQIELVIELLGRLFGWKGLEFELERTEARLDLVRRRLEIQVGLLLPSYVIKDRHRLLLANRCGNAGADHSFVGVVRVRVCMRSTSSLDLFSRVSLAFVGSGI